VLRNSSESGTNILTGQFRRTPVEWRIDQIIERIHAEKAGVVSVAYLDIDGFGHIESAYGYGLADALLDEIAERLARLERATFTTRYVRDSFLIVYDGLQLEEAFLATEEIRRQLSSAPFVVRVGVESAVIETTFSAGVATYPGDPKDRYELISLAEEAALRADEGGGARTMFGRSPTMTTKTSHYSPLQLERLRLLREKVGRSDASLLREALDDLLRKYDQRDVRRGLADAVARWVTRHQGGEERKEPTEQHTASE